MLTRRKLVLGAALAALVPAAPALAAPDPLLADILYGVSDALIRDYIYRNYEYGRWDGRYWWYRGNRYTPATYRRFWIDDYYRHYPPPPPAHRPPPPGTGLRLRRTSTDRAVVRLRGPRNLRAEGLREDRIRGHRSLRTAAVRVRLTSEGRAAGARAVQAVPADAAAPQSAPRRA